MIAVNGQTRLSDNKLFIVDQILLFQYAMFIFLIFCSVEQKSNLIIVIPQNVRKET